MNPKLRQFLEANGLRADATEQEAWSHYDKLVAEGVAPTGIEIGNRSAAPAAQVNTPATPATPAPTPAAPPVDVDAAVARALMQEAQRRNDIEDRLRISGLMDADGGNFARGLLNDTAMTIERASAAIFARMRTANPAIGAGAYGSMEVGIDGRDKLRAAITDGLLLRSGHRLENPADGAREFRGRSLVEVCREVLISSGQSVRGLSNMDIAGRALASGSTSDFPAIFAALVNRHLLQAYMEWPQTWRPFVGVTSASDFKDIYAIKLSGAPDLQGLSENGEYKTAVFSDAKETYRVVTKGIRVPLTRVMIINDDLRAFTRIPQLFGASARRMEADAVYSLITTNGAMSDGVALYHADHKNLAAANADITSASLSLARAAMRKQTGLNGEVIDVTPAFLVVPVSQQTDAEVLLRSAALPTAEMSAGVHNPWAGQLTPIADPHLDANSVTAWYLFAHPNQVPTIEVSYLEGEEQPYVEEMLDFNSDALITKVRHDFGAGVVDHVGTYKNIGA